MLYGYYPWVVSCFLTASCLYFRKNMFKKASLGRRSPILITPLFVSWLKKRNPNRELWPFWMTSVLRNMELLLVQIKICKANCVTLVARTNTSKILLKDLKFITTQVWKSLKRFWRENLHIWKIGKYRRKLHLLIFGRKFKYLKNVKNWWKCNFWFLVRKFNNLKLDQINKITRFARKN